MIDGHGSADARAAHDASPGGPAGRGRTGGRGRCDGLPIGRGGARRAHVRPGRRGGRGRRRSLVRPPAPSAWGGVHRLRGVGSGRRAHQDAARLLRGGPDRRAGRRGDRHRPPRGARAGGRARPAARRHVCRDAVRPALQPVRVRRPALPLPPGQPRLRRRLSRAPARPARVSDLAAGGPRAGRDVGRRLARLPRPRRPRLPARPADRRGLLLRGRRADHRGQLARDAHPARRLAAAAALALRRLGRALQGARRRRPDRPPPRRPASGRDDRALHAARGPAPRRGRGVHVLVRAHRRRRPGGTRRSGGAGAAVHDPARSRLPPGRLLTGPRTPRSSIWAWPPTPS